jgi:pyruvate formate lyase activating enzyme
MHAYLYQSEQAETVRCILCSHRCLIKKGKRGICGVRQNNAGRLETLVYGRLIARNVDPIEKKPLFHLKPGSRSYSIATVGCNFRCRFCQNADIAQMPADHSGQIMGASCTARQVVDDALARRCSSIAYTYTEPTIFFEFAYDTARMAHQKGIANVFVTNGYMTPEALQMAAPYLDGANVDLKAFNAEFYKTQCSARIEPVKETLKGMKATGMILEVTTLLIPGLNDDPAELRGLAEFLVKDLGPDTPWHISRFHPTYKLLDRPPTALETLRTARDIGTAAGLRYVYMGNVSGEGGENTYCHGCGRLLIERLGYHIQRNVITSGCCPQCHTPVYGRSMSADSP